ncbi:UNVERIFIED_CONTAM: Retrovirus-related Pol polyprotein from transposon RE2 [Sesamum angustifolium]|uniref:Retrovirus-related Pol polyprotein from transposon RE2 n=1 Tax=Sesamum angustifolium TaxID=2727405 RepID=A0AAW2P3P0_9LAMI
MAETSSTGENRMMMPAKLQLHGSDHPGMVLVSAPLTGNNYLKESNDIVEAFMYTKSSRNLWLDLEQRYGECNGPQLYQLQREICSMTQGTAPLSSYFTNIKKLWDEMSELKPVPQCTCHGCTCGASKAMTDMASFTQLMQFLMGLSDVFDSVRHQLLVMDPVPSINKAYAMVQSVEKAKANKRPQYCVHCDRAGHSKETCFKIHGTPDWYKELQDKRRRDTIPARGFTVDANPMKEVHSETRGRVTAGTYQTYENWFSDGFSARKLCTIRRFCSSLARWQYSDQKNNRILAVGKQKGNLYFLDTSSFDSAVINSYINNRNNVLHPKFVIDLCGTTGWVTLPLLYSQHIPEIKHLNETQTNDCCICPLAKQHRLSFPSSITRSKHMFKLIHTDVWGPYKIASLTNCNYFLTIVDDFTRATWTFLLKHKSQVHHTLATFFTMVNTQFHTSIKVVRSDNGSEFVNAQCKTLFNSLGIIHQTSCAYTPQQNGIVERKHKHKHILEIARALLFQSHLPKRFWGEAVLTATYLINRLPSSILDWKSPFEMLYNKPPNIAHLRVILSLKKPIKCITLIATPFSSRDVVFHEHTFPFQAVSIDSDPVSIPLPIVDSDVHTPSQDPPIPFSNSLHPFPVTQPAVPTSSDTHIPLRRSQRTTSKPSWLNDYECNCISSNADSCIPSSYSTAHLSFVAHLSSLQEPKDYLQASKDSNWVATMNKELEALKANDTWILTSLPPGKQTIGSCWVFKLKLNPDGSVERYKAA